MTISAKNRGCLWYDGGAADATRFYANTFPDSFVGAVRGADNPHRCDESDADPAAENAPMMAGMVSSTFSGKEDRPLLRVARTRRLNRVSAPAAGFQLSVCRKAHGAMTWLEPRSGLDEAAVFAHCPFSWQFDSIQPVI